jgi:DNA-binding NtrC family response regulator
MVARAIHQLSERADGPYVAVNCGAIPEGLIESELFGHEKGAFTGSVAKRSGYFTQADGGTILLDEIGEMKPDMQVKLLRTLEDGVFYPLGSDKPQRANVRVIAATNRDLESAINSGAFRDDLYFRLAGVKLITPSLAERREDIFPLLALFSAETQLAGYSSEALSELQQFDWPGNVRQLKNFVTRMGALVGDREVSLPDVRRYTSEHGFRGHSLPALTTDSEPKVGQELIYRALLSLGAEVKGLRELIVANLPGAGIPQGGAEYSDLGDVTDVTDIGPLDNPADINNLSLHDSASEIGSLEEMEARLMDQTLRDTGGNRRLAAERLGIGERTLYSKLKKYGLS